MPKEDVADERIAKDGYHLLRMRLDRLEKNINKPAPIPAMRAEVKKPRAPPDFVRNVVGSSAAAGSAEFHIFRNNRRKEMQRLDYLKETSKLQDLSSEFQRRRDYIEKEEEEKTAKKRAKRLRRKEKLKKLKKAKKGGNADSDEESDEDESEEEEEEEDNEESGENEETEKKTEDEESSKDDETTEKTEKESTDAPEQNEEEDKHE